MYDVDIWEAAHGDYTYQLMAYASNDPDDNTQIVVKEFTCSDEWLPRSILAREFGIKPSQIDFVQQCAYC